MKIKEYQDYVWGVFKPEIRDDPKIAPIYLWGKLFNELIEFRHEYQLGNFHNLPSELGDCCWYLANLLRVYDVHIMPIGNIQKHEQYILDNIDSLITSIGFAMGTVLKNSFHGKDLDRILIVSTLEQTYITLQILSTSCYNSDGVAYTFSEILDKNVDKLMKRHGKQYDASFYKG